MTSHHDRERAVLHAVRLLGYAGTARVGERAGVPFQEAEEALLDAQAAGRVAWSRFGDDGGWSLTERGEAVGERLLADELDRADARPVLESVMTAFEPLNTIVTGACTRWQLTELGMATPPADLADVLGDLSRASGSWALLEERLVLHLPRFDGYHARFDTAVARAHTDPAWVTATNLDSAHRVWFELHEDLLATLGRSR